MEKILIVILEACDFKSCEVHINHSFLTYKKEAKEFGYEVGKISMKEKTVIFNKI